MKIVAAKPGSPETTAGAPGYVLALSKECFAAPFPSSFAWFRDGYSIANEALNTFTASGFDQRKSITSQITFTDGSKSKLEPLIIAEIEQDLAPPADLKWSALYPLTVSSRGCSIDPRSLVDASIWSGTTYHVTPSGNDANDGLTVGNAKASLHSAITAGNTAATPFVVNVAQGEYEQGWASQNGNVSPTQHCAIIANGSTYRAGKFSQTWTLDEGTTYQISATSTKRVFRTDVLTDEGTFVELTKAASLLACRATANSFFQDVSQTYANVDVAPTSTSMLVVRGFNSFVFDEDVDVYIEGLTTQGGISGGISVTGAHSRAFVAVDCSFGYPAHNNESLYSDTVDVTRAGGVAGFFNCDAVGGHSDNWNMSVNGAGVLYVILDNCRGLDAGDAASFSCNDYTTHDKVISIVANSEFGGAVNGNVFHCIDDTRTWVINTEVRATSDAGSGVKISSDAICYFEESATRAIGTANALEANSGDIRTLSSIIVGPDTAYASGSIEEFTR